VLRSEWDVAADLREGRLRRVLAPWVGQSADIHAVYPHRHLLTAKVQVFLDFLAERFADFRPAQTDQPARW
jgi:DNA-binding transcriptional LysR family regulator